MKLIARSEFHNGFNLVKKGSEYKGKDGKAFIDSGLLMEEGSPLHEFMKKNPNPKCTSCVDRRKLQIQLGALSPIKLKKKEKDSKENKDNGDSQKENGKDSGDSKENSDSKPSSNPEQKDKPKPGRPKNTNGQKPKPGRPKNK